MPDERAEVELVTRAQAGDRDAFAALVERYQQSIGGYIWRLTGDRELAQDLTQETFLRAYRAIGYAPPDLMLRPWLYRIATNLVYDHFRRWRRIRWLPLPTLERSPQTEDWAGLEHAEDIWRALATLSSRERAVLLLCALEGYSYRETAVILGGSPEAVRKRFVRARERFRQAYSAHQREDALADPRSSGGGLAPVVGAREITIFLAHPLRLS